jgi:hypothetical protein
MTTTIKALYRCEDCGHEQLVSEHHTEDGSVYAGSGANWCDSCNTGKPHRVDPFARKKRIYISGPMTGLPGLNFPAFNTEAARLQALGYDVVNPVNINPDPATPWNECMRKDLKALLDCDILVLLEGWQKSTGAQLEMHLAHRVGIEIFVAKEFA